MLANTVKAVRLSPKAGKLYVYPRRQGSCFQIGTLQKRTLPRRLPGESSTLKIFSFSNLPKLFLLPPFLQDTLSPTNVLPLIEVRFMDFFDHKLIQP
jgi:hypothetical protein